MVTGLLQGLFESSVILNSSKTALLSGTIIL